ncbi:MAG: hypothetical protein Q7R62_01615 [bacterium]|nr:hypothetical protein [bacterium]
MAYESLKGIPEFELMPALDPASDAGIDEIIAQTPMGTNEKQEITMVIQDFRNKIETAGKREFSKETSFEETRKAIVAIVGRFESSSKVGFKVHKNFLPRIFSTLRREAGLPSKEEK